MEVEGGEGTTVSLQKLKEGGGGARPVSSCTLLSEGHKAAKPRELKGQGSKWERKRKWGAGKRSAPPTTTNLGNRGWGDGGTLPDSREQ